MVPPLAPPSRLVPRGRLRGLPPGKARLRPRTVAPRRTADAGAANLFRQLGVWRSLVARSVRVGEVPSSNLGTPIIGCLLTKNSVRVVHRRAAHVAHSSQADAN